MSGWVPCSRLREHAHAATRRGHGTHTRTVHPRPSHRNRIERELSSRPGIPGGVAFDHGQRLQHAFGHQAVEQGGLDKLGKAVVARAAISRNLVPINVYAGNLQIDQGPADLVRRAPRGSSSKGESSNRCCRARAFPGRRARRRRSSAAVPWANACEIAVPSRQMYRIRRSGARGAGGDRQTGPGRPKVRREREDKQSDQ